MKKPKVSIIIPVLNCEQYIAQAIKSALNQSFQDFEIMVVDGASADRTPLIVKEFSERDKRINFVNQLNPGLASARNYGVEIAKGDYIAFLEADDLWHPDKLLLQVKCLESKPDVGLVSCYSAVIDENSLLLGWRLGVDMNGMVYKRVIERNPISTCSIPLIRRECLQNVGLFDERIKYIDDAELWIRFTRKFPIATIPKALVGYRRWSSNRSTDYKGMIEDGEFVLEKVFKKDPALTKSFYNFCISRNASTITGMCIIDGRYKEARESLIHSIKKSKIALLTDFRMLGIALLVILTSIIPPIIFKKTVLNFLLPRVFKIKPGNKFVEV